MVDSGEGAAGTTEDPRARFARLEAEIAKAHRHLASLRHEGERHFIDEEPVHPEVPGLLEEVVRRSRELEHLRGSGPGSHAVNPAASSPDDEHRRLADLEARIARLNQLVGDDPHTHERHFIDG